MKTTFQCASHDVVLTISKERDGHEVRVISSGGNSAQCILSRGHTVDRLISEAAGQGKARHFIRGVRPDGRPDIATERIALIEQEGGGRGGLA